ncbi:toprim domain-containing protein [Actinoplanes sp. LDG1-06]|uniref:Toprim domain-containing protein n=1 Tax=Paractinoplanes ovalisporus TaxID=2810368 RepID=A0ABS2AN26_9ACTN|nr:toprim domain-containing protein [Actinoplanes ovalisporus]MBM2621200.1 toprim domain-containing protein [Actinoplanes ovalisporus]
MKALGLPPTSADQVTTACPVHGGDKRSAFSIGVGKEGNGYPVLTCHTGCPDSKRTGRARLPWVHKARRALMAAGAPVEAVGPTGLATRRSKAAASVLSPTPSAPLVEATPPSQDSVDRWVYQAEGPRLATLAQNRGLAAATLDDADVGWNGREYTIPVYDPASHELVDLQRYAIGGKLVHRKGGKARLYATPEGFDPSSLVLVCEGVWDVLAARQHGLNAVGVTGGAGSVPKDLSALTGCDVSIVFDSDDEGRKGARKLAAALVGAARSVCIADLGLPDKGDVRDWLVKLGIPAGELLDLAKAGQPYDETTAAQDEYDDRVHSKLEDLRAAHAAKLLFQSEQAAARHAASTRPRVADGADFFLDIPKQAPVLWGDGSRCLWIDGEPFMVVGDDGTGKSTLDHQLMACRLGLLGDGTLLGYTVEPAPGRLLYLAMDRPEQARRAGGRLFPSFRDKEHRDVLRERLAVWRGPLPVDPLSGPEALADWIRAEFGRDICEVHVDSLKDITSRLTDDAVGSGLNSSIQAVVERGINWVGLHHQRKSSREDRRRGGGDDLSDVYGSRWLVAGHGSIVMLSKTGDDNNDYVEMHQVKQPMDNVPRLLLQHDRATGRTRPVRISRDVDLILTDYGSVGATVREVAALMFAKEDNELTTALVSRAKRQLEKEVSAGRALHVKGKRGGVGGSTPERYVLAEG